MNWSLKAVEQKKNDVTVCPISCVLTQNRPVPWSLLHMHHPNIQSFKYNKPEDNCNFGEWAKMYVYCPLLDIKVYVLMHFWVTVRTIWVNVNMKISQFRLIPEHKFETIKFCSGNQPRERERTRIESPTNILAPHSIGCNYAKTFFTFRCHWINLFSQIGRAHFHSFHIHSHVMYICLCSAHGEFPISIIIVVVMVRWSGWE